MEKVTKLIQITQVIPISNLRVATTRRGGSCTARLSGKDSSSSWRSLHSSSARRSSTRWASAGGAGGPLRKVIWLLSRSRTLGYCKISQLPFPNSAMLKEYGGLTLRVRVIDIDLVSSSVCHILLGHATIG